MKFIVRYMKKYKWRVIAAFIIKFLGTSAEFMIPYILEYLLDEVAPQKDLKLIIAGGLVMIADAFFVRQFNVIANRKAVKVASDCIYDVRRDLFDKTMSLSGGQVDKYGLPSLTSRMTSDSYNIQNFIRTIQTLGVRAPILLLGGLIVTMVMDSGLAMILLVLVPLLILSIVIISRKGIPLYDTVQQKMDSIVRVMRENITGIRVIKALSKEDHEKRRFSDANKDMFESDTKASVLMSLPGPIMMLLMNIGLTVVVVIGAYRVNGGVTQPAVILAFLTYFNMILMGVNGLNRIFVLISKANASASRIAAVVDEGVDLETVYGSEDGNDEAASAANGHKAGVSGADDYIRFDNVSFSYPGTSEGYEVEDISFAMKKGSSLGIIGATGSGKTTIINLLMRFYDTTKGTITVEGRDVKSYPLKELRRRFGAVFQNDVIFADTLCSNVAFGRDVDEKRALEAVNNAQAGEFVAEYEDGINHRADIHGANLSGGQKQRILIARALAAKPDILVLDDSSSALDYKTDSLLRQVIREKYNNTTSIVIAQRISSIMSLDNIIVLDDGRIVGQGTHDELMAGCPLYKEIYDVQMN